MTRANDLAEWLRTQLSLRSVAVEAPLAEDALPGAIVHYQGAGDGDTLDPELRTEAYQVAFYAPSVGAEPVQVQTEIGRIEARLAGIINGPERKSLRWKHITATLIGADRQSGISLWLFTVWVTGD